MSVRRCQSEMDSVEFAEWMFIDRMATKKPMIQDAKMIEKTMGLFYGRNK